MKRHLSSLRAQLTEARARAEKAEGDIKLIAEVVENDDCDHLPLVERVGGMRDSLMLMIGKWMDGRKVTAERDDLAATVTVLRDLLEECMVYVNSYPASNAHTVAAVKAALAATPAMNLNAVKSEALREARKRMDGVMGGVAVSKVIEAMADDLERAAQQGSDPHV